MICMLCDHTANTTGCFWDLQVTKCLCIFLPICLCVCVCLCVCECVCLKPSTDLLCSAPEIESSPVDEPELGSVFLGLCGLQTNSVSRYFPGCEEERGSFRSCSSLLCYWDNKGGSDLIAPRLTLPGRSGMM